MARYDDIYELEPDLDGAGLRIGIVMGRFNIEISEGLLSACTAELRKHGVSAEDITLVTVPGSLEVPITLQAMADSGDYDALIALGAVIRGDTYHFEVVADQSAAGMMHVQLDAGIPIANGVLTTETDDQALARMTQKGADVARVAIEMANLLAMVSEGRE